MAGPLPTEASSNGVKAQRTTRDHEHGRLEDDWKTEDAGELILRLDHQTFVKMPKSGSVFFGVHPMRRKLKELEDLPLLPALLLKVSTEGAGKMKVRMILKYLFSPFRSFEPQIHAEGSSDLMNYKAAPSYEGSVIPYLKAMHQRQIQRGLIKGDERPSDFRDFQRWIG